MTQDYIRKIGEKYIREADFEILREAGELTDISEIALSFAYTYPKNANERSAFLTVFLGFMLDSLMKIYVDSTVEVLRYEDKSQKKSLSPSEMLRKSQEALNDSSQKSFNVLGILLILILVLEDSIGTNITPNVEYVEKKEIKAYKAKIRSKLPS